jgi:hypothetical protein
MRPPTEFRNPPNPDHECLSTLTTPSHTLAHWSYFHFSHNQLPQFLRNVGGGGQAGTQSCCNRHSSRSSRLFSISRSCGHEGVISIFGAGPHSFFCSSFSGDGPCIGVGAFCSIGAALSGTAPCNDKTRAGPTGVWATNGTKTVRGTSMTSWGTLSGCGCCCGAAHGFVSSAEGGVTLIRIVLGRGGHAALG